MFLFRSIPVQAVLQDAFHFALSFKLLLGAAHHAHANESGYAVLNTNLTGRFDRFPNISANQRTVFAQICQCDLFIRKPRRVFCLFMVSVLVSFQVISSTLSLFSNS